MRTITVLALAALAAPAFADGDGGHRYQRMPAAYVQECGSCHAPFPPRLLPRDSWQRVMDGLARHYGTDASVDEPTQRALATWLAANASTRLRSAPPEDRLTRTAWFVREHDEVPASAWSRPAIKSPANCGACHGGAAQGDFNEHAVRIPR